jgi:hypothetical protein
MQGNYSVIIEVFAMKHFIKSFEKKHKIKWGLTLQYIKEELARIDNLLLTSRAETIIDVGTIKIIKTKFRVVDTKESAKTYGNRSIVAWNKEKQVVSVLLVYSKTDIASRNETAEWQRLIRENYSEYKHLFKNS